MLHSKASRSGLLALFAALPLLLAGPAIAAETDLSDSPLSTATETAVKPNILFILDDSGSMNWKFMPDDLSASEERIGFRNNRCNLVYYNPASRYVTPKTADGSDINSGAPTAYTAAYNDGYADYYGWETRTSSDSGASWTGWSSVASCSPDTSGSSRRDCRVALLGSSGSTTNLSTGFRAFVNDTIENNSVTTKVDTAQPAYYWKYLGTQSLLPEVGDCRKQVSPSFTVNGAVYASGVVTFQTSTAHNFLVGQTVGVSGIQPSGYRRTDYVVTNVPDSTHFKANLASNPGGYTNSGTAWNATEYATINEYCTDDTRTTSTCAALGKTALWRKVLVSATSGPMTVDISGDGLIDAGDQDERQNFANWYSYYSNRMKSMKAAAGRAFVGMTDSKRIGFLTINPGSPVTTKKFQAIGDFGTAQRETWFNTLYSQIPGPSTPLREALSRAGRYFAHKTDSINSGMNDDPVQYSCQQNFSILTTDGYWNSEGGLKLDGTTDMDNQDGIISELDLYRPAGSKYAMSPRPIFDGASSTYTWNTATRSYQNVSCPRQQQKIQQTQISSFGHWEQQTTQLQKKTGQLQYRSTLERKTGQLQSTTNLQSMTGQLQYQSKIQKKTGQLQWTTNQQRRTGQLQYQSKIQSKTGQLQWTTNQQSKTGQLQWTTDQQRKTGQLQFRTTLQRMAGQLQYDSYLQSGVGQLKMWTSNNSGGSWTGPFLVSTCTEDFDGSNWTFCYVDVPAANWTYVASCTPTRTGVSGSYDWTGGAAAVDCRTLGTSSGWTDTGSCTEVSGTVGCRVNGAWSYVTTYAPSCTPTRTGSAGSYAWTGASAVDCRTEPANTFNPSWTSTTTCTESATVQCQVGTGTWTYMTTYPGTCTPTRTGSPGSYAWTGGAAAVDCQSAGSFNPTWTSNTVCLESAITQCRVGTGTFGYITTYPGTCTPSRTGSAGSYSWTGGASAVDCQTAGSFNPTWNNNTVCQESAVTNCKVNVAAWSKAQSCTPTRTGSAGSYSWTGGATAIDCQNTGVLDGTWSSATTCNESSDVACQVSAAATVAYITTYPGTCTPSRTGSAGSYAWTGGASAVDCQTAGSFNGTWANNSVCQESAITNCKVNVAAWSKAQSCTPTRTGSAGSYAWSGNASAIDCQNTGVLDGTWSTATTCNESSDIACRVNGTWAYVSSLPPTCTPTRTGSAGSYAWTGGASAVDCQTAGAFNATWTNRSTCTESANTQCRINSATWSQVTSCTPTRTGSAGSYAWSGNASAIDCQTVPFGAWTNASTCNENAQVECRVNASPVGVASCTPTRTGSAGSYAWTGNASAIDCNTVATAPWATVPYACTTASIDSSGYTVECQFLGGTAFADAATCTEDATTACQLTDLGAWAAANICVASVTPDASGQITLCQPSGSTGSKLQSYSTTTATTYSGPGQTGATLGTPTTINGPLTDVTAGACYAAAPAIPATETVTGVGPPAPPENCTSGVQVWPCETYSSGSGGLTANISGAVWTGPGVDPTLDPATATFTTAAAHQFLVGHSVTVATVNPAGYRGNYQIIEVADNTHFKVEMPSDPGAFTGAGTASLFAGSSNSVADVAQYYYKTDLRNASLGNCTGALGTSVCDDNVPSTGTGVEDDRANWQHMTSFTMGMGLTGTVVYSPNYKTDQCVAKSISGATWSGGYATVTTTAPHGFYVNEAVTIAGGTNGVYRGQYRVYDVLSTTTFRYALAANPGGSFGTGTATGCPDFNRIRSGTINWPVPVAGNRTALDDLWHAAVNGRGQYFSAGDPDSVVSGLSSALNGIDARVGAAAAAATSNLEPVAGDNFAYTAKYKTKAWTGDLEAREIDLTTGAVSGSVIWSAQGKLDLKTKSACDNRTIKLFRGGATDNLVDFRWGTYLCDASGAPTGAAQNDLVAAEQSNFNAAKVALLSHYANLGDGTGATVDQRTPAAGVNLVNFLRGQRGKEGFSSALPMTNTDVNKLYRTREHVLGDIINAQPVFVKGPFAEYDDTGYAAFKNGAAASRTPMVYASANDGMLHAFYAGSSIVDTNGGNEAWAFIPTMVLPNLYKLASENYEAGHVYTVDGTPSVGDVDDPILLPAPPTPRWKTILVSGLNKGGKGYYALDISDPENPKALWEFKHDAGNCVTVDATTKAPATDEYSDCHIGYSFNNPVISKLRDGRWVVFVTSGYNNVNSPSAPGDGVGYLYVLDAMTGKILYKIDTGAGDAATPSGLNHISAWVEGSTIRNNLTERVYGVDLLGNVWRFDVNDILNASGREATLIAQVVDGSGVGQPITTRPELAMVDGSAYVYVGTGRYLGTTDAGNLQTQSVWALRDSLSSTTMTNLRSTLRKMTVVNQGSGTAAYRTNSCTTNCGSMYGWFVDLPDSGERVNIDMKLQLGTLVVASNVPETNACNFGGYAWLNYFNNRTGEAIANSQDHAVGRRLVGTGGQESLAVGLNIVRLPSGKTVVIATTSAAQQLTVEAPFDVAPPTGKRVSWREIVQ
jgi:Tfp pilus tip-associated adhesin PilY1